ncbi:caspase-1-like isoform X2 [Periplaneta americana]|uniref:caspase-1-like isoform X2 n=1 Tax=Periplaneta americana TaxID=6978 RepID=UPI0037E9055B
MNDKAYDNDRMDTESNQHARNLMSLSIEQLEPLSSTDKDDKINYPAGETGSRFCFDRETIRASLEEGDDPFTPTESDLRSDDDEDEGNPFSDSAPMDVPNPGKQRERRVSDVIDSIGDRPPDATSLPQMVLNSQRLSNVARGPISPVSSGYGSVDGGTPKVLVSPDWQQTTPPSSRKTRKVDVTDASISVSDALPMDEQSIPPPRALEADMVVHKDADEYNMHHPRRGKAIILNHDKFDNGIMPPRDGSEFDVKRLKTTYEVLGFEVTVHDNLEYAQIKSVITNLAQEDHSDADCLMVTVLTHGMPPNFLLSRDVPYHVDMLWSYFTADNCPTLAGKPKLFIIQACRGQKLDPGVTLKERRGSRTETDSSSTSAPYKIPTHADFLIAYSSVEGYFSWRNPENGTWFIQCLCQELQENAMTHDILKIMTRTARRVALDHESFNDINPWQHQQKQVPSFNSMLIRDLYFRPKA